MKYTCCTLCGTGITSVHTYPTQRPSKYLVASLHCAALLLREQAAQPRVLLAWGGAEGGWVGIVGLAAAVGGTHAYAPTDDAWRKGRSVACGGLRAAGLGI